MDSTKFPRDIYDAESLCRGMPRSGVHIILRQASIRDAALKSANRVVLCHEVDQTVGTFSELTLSGMPRSTRHPFSRTDKGLRLMSHFDGWSGVWSGSVNTSARDCRELICLAAFGRADKKIAAECKCSSVQSLPIMVTMRGLNFCRCVPDQVCGGIVRPAQHTRNNIGCFSASCCG